LIAASHVKSIRSQSIAPTCQQPRCFSTTPFVTTTPLVIACLQRSPEQSLLWLLICHLHERFHESHSSAAASTATYCLTRARGARGQTGAAKTLSISLISISLTKTGLQRTCKHPGLARATGMVLHKHTQRHTDRQTDRHTHTNTGGNARRDISSPVNYARLHILLKRTRSCDISMYSEHIYVKSQRTS